MEICYLGETCPILLIFQGVNSPYPRTILQEFQNDPRKKVFFDTPYYTYWSAVIFGTLKYDSL